jgi:hypothetical protein
MGQQREGLDSPFTNGALVMIHQNSPLESDYMEESGGTLKEWLQSSSVKLSCGVPTRNNRRDGSMALDQPCMADNALFLSFYVVM